jgi:hypothetical protein
MLQGLIKRGLKAGSITSLTGADGVKVTGIAVSLPVKAGAVIGVKDIAAAVAGLGGVKLTPSLTVKASAPGAEKATSAARITFTPTAAAIVAAAWAEGFGVVIADKTPAKSRGAGADPALTGAPGTNGAGK